MLCFQTSDYVFVRCWESVHVLKGTNQSVNQYNKRTPKDDRDSESTLSLMIGIGSTSLLTGNTEDGVHVVVTHVSSLGRNVFRVHGTWKPLLAH